MNEKNYETKWHTVRESYLRMLIGKAMKYDILMDDFSKIEVNSEDFYGEIYRGLTGEELTIPNDQAHFIKRVNFVNGEIIRQTDETIESLDLAAKKNGFE
mgnify:FL=1